MRDDDRKDEDTVTHTKDVVEGKAAADPKLVAELVAVVKKHQGKVYGVCLRIVRDPEVARELAQDALVTAYQKLPTFDGQSSLSTWIVGIAKHLAMNKVRKKGELLSEDGVVELTAEGRTALQEMTRAERVAFVKETMLSVLEPQEQEIAFLRYGENLPYDAIAGCVGLEDANAVRVALQRIRSRVKRGVERQLTDMGAGTSFVYTRDVESLQ